VKASTKSTAGARYAIPVSRLRRLQYTAIAAYWLAMDFIAALASAMTVSRLSSL
jgi:hypothetical protein